MSNLNSLPYDKIWDWPLKHLPTTSVAQILIFVNDRVENIVGKGENAGYQNFLLFPQCFRKVI